MTITCTPYSWRVTWRNASLLALSLALIGLTSCSKTNNGNPTAPLQVASLILNLPSATMRIGDTVQLTATPVDANNHPLSGHNVTWSSDHPEFATVNSSGLVTAVDDGDAIITVTSDGISISKTIRVSGAKVSTVTVTPASASIAVGGTVQLTAVPQNANGMVQLTAIPKNSNHTPAGRVVKWSSADASVATVDGSGLVTGVAAGGPVTITARCAGKSGTSAITVNAVPLVPVASVTVGPASASVAAGSTVQLTATPRDASNNPLTGRLVTWSSANTAVAMVNTNGLVSGIAAGGPVTVTATCETKTGTSAITVTPGSAGGQFNHVFIVAEENTNYADVIGNRAMPYLNGLAQRYGLATEYYANTHPSIGNYLMMTCGQIITNNDGYSHTVSADNVVRELVAAGKTWKAYAEDIPSAGFVTLDYDDGHYASRHNPVVYYTDVHDNPAQAAHVVPFTQFATDLATYNFPNYSFITPNLCDDGHDCGGDVVDAWLQTHIDPLIRSPRFQQDGLLIIVYDESGGDNTNGGGRIVWVAVSGKSKPAYQSTTLYQHQSTLRLSLKALGVTVFPGAANSAPDMGEFFNP